MSPDGRAPAAVTGLAHIALATAEADAMADMLCASLGATRGHEELLEQGALRVVFVHVGPVIHHVSLEVADLPAALASAKAAGARLIDEQPRAGAHGTQVAFLHPKSFGGMLLELCQAPKRPGGRDA